MSTATLDPKTKKARRDALAAPANAAGWVSWVDFVRPDGSTGSVGHQAPTMEVLMDLTSLSVRYYEEEVGEANGSGVNYAVLRPVNAWERCPRCRNNAGKDPTPSNRRAPLFNLDPCRACGGSGVRPDPEPMLAEVGYAYFSSTTAKKLGACESGCWFARVFPASQESKPPGKQHSYLGPFDSWEEARANALAATGCLGRWSQTGPGGLK